MVLTENDKNNLKYIEHRWMRYVFYSINDLPAWLENEKGQVFCDLLRAMNKETPGYTCPWGAEDFRIDSIQFPDMPIKMTRIRFPELSEPLLCRSIYLVSSLKEKAKFLYTVERSQEGSYLIGGWSPDDAYIIFHPDVPANADEEAAVIASLFKTAGCYDNINLILKKGSIKME